MSATMLYTAGEAKPARLFVCDAGRTMRTVDIGQGITLGRAGTGIDVDLPLNSGIVSKRHGRITKLDTGYCYSDTDSLNGTHINGILYGKDGESSSCILNDGDILRIDRKNLDRPHHEAVVMIFSTSWQDAEWQSVELREDTGNINIGRTTVAREGIKIADPAVSKKHATFIHGVRGWSIVDHGSTNGVFVNGERIAQPRPLHAMDVVRIVNTLFIFLGDRLLYNAPAVQKNQLAIHIEERSVRNLFKKRILLENIDLSIDPGDMVLVLGGSGAGKTTFFNAVMGYEKARGKIVHDGRDIYKEYAQMKYEIGFVPQQDLLRDDDTVYHTLDNAAQMKMPADTANDARQARIDQVLEMLGLQRERDSLVKKLSGGQKKRLNIAVEFIADPSLFFLDEPDSGLDGIMAAGLMENLRVIADEGKIVMVITHAPDRVAHLFDKVIVLAKSAKTNSGHLAFYGSIDAAKEFFDADSLEGIVKRINRPDENGDGLSDFYIEKYEKYIGESI